MKKNNIITFWLLISVKYLDYFWKSCLYHMNFQHMFFARFPWKMSTNVKNWFARCSSVFQLLHVFKKFKRLQLKTLELHKTSVYTPNPHHHQVQRFSEDMWQACDTCMTRVWHLCDVCQRWRAFLAATLRFTSSWHLPTRNWTCCLLWLVVWRGRDTWVPPTHLQLTVMLIIVELLCRATCQPVC